MGSTIKAFVNRCDTCNLRNKFRNKRVGVLPLKPMPRRFEEVHCDVVGPFPMTLRGNKYLICFTDVATHWRSYWPIPEITQELFLDAFAWGWMKDNAIPRVLYTDFASNIGGEIVIEAGRTLGFRHRHSDIKVHQQNGLSEQGNSKVYEFLTHFCKAKNRTDWDEMVPWLCSVLNGTWDRTRGTTPYFLSHGTHARMGVEKLVRETVLKEDPLPDSSDVVTEIRSRLAAGMDVAAQAYIRTSHQQVRAYEKVHKDIVWSPGDMCRVVHETGFARAAVKDAKGPGEKLYNSAAGPWILLYEYEDRVGTWLVRHQYMGTLMSVNYKLMESMGPLSVEEALEEAPVDDDVKQDADLFARLYPGASVPDHKQGIEDEEKKQEYALEKIVQVNGRGGKSWQAQCKWEGFDDLTWEPASSFVGVGLDGQQGYDALYAFYDEPARWLEMPKLPISIRTKWTGYAELRDKHAAAAKAMGLTGPARRRARKR
jgi:hypothetical protein